MTLFKGSEDTLTERTLRIASERIMGQRRDLRSLLAFAGPAIVASVAYMDPGNFATNIEGGARYDYDLLWVVLLANVAAMLFQALAAKLGIVTGKNLPELCRQHFPRRIVWFIWVVSEIAAMATDLAEFLGGAIGFSLLFGMPLLGGMIITGIATCAILALELKGFRPVELVIAGFVLIIGFSYLIELAVIPPDWHAAAYHTIVPRLADSGAVALAVAIIGATVMPHAIYLHSGLTQRRIPSQNDEEKKKVLGLSNREILIALGFAGLVNMAMVMMAAAAFHNGYSDVAGIETAYHTLAPLLGGAAAGLFLISLIASGLSSSVVGTMAGQLIMEGFVRFRISIWLRRLITMIPAFIVVALGVNATQALVISQVILSLALPVPMIALLIITRRKDIMRGFANSRTIATVSYIAAGVILAMNGLLIMQIF
jgi:manganese transport protein